MIQTGVEAGAAFFGRGPRAGQADDGGDGLADIETDNGTGIAASILAAAPKEFEPSPNARPGTSPGRPSMVG